MSLTPLSFTGISNFSSDFQSIVNRTVAIASLPVQSLQNDQTSLGEKRTALTNLRGAVGSFAASLETLGTLGGGGATSVSSSSSNITATLGTGATPGNYQITDITSLADTAIATSTGGWATADATQVSTGADHKVELLIGGVSHEITLTPETDNLNGLRDAINTLGAGASASLIDTGASAGAQRYFLVLSAQQAGPATLELRTESGNAASASMELTKPGSSASFKVNGRLVTSNDNYIAGVVPGVNLRLNATSAIGQVINLSVAANAAPVVNALTGFVSSYNDLASSLDAHIGETAGVLSGDSLISGLYGLLREATGLPGAGNIKSLAELGITLDSSGIMSFDSSAVSTAGQSRLNDIFSFLGSPTSGLAALTSRFTEISDPATGQIRARLTSLDQTDARLTEQISTMTERVSTMQTTLLAKLQAADGLLARLENQRSMLTASIDSLNMLTNGKSEG
ncbi:MAG: flagellar filament capping protein FliD [Bryobacterales bacterium]|nr:flagellar filament capping protein FliD [Bryobacterales bacterium]